MKEFQVGDVVKSKINTVYKGTYTIEKTNKTTCWVTPNEGQKFVYKNVRYSILRKV